MRELRLLEVAADGSHVVLEACDDSEPFVLPAEVALTIAVDAFGGPPAAAPAPATAPAPVAAPGSNTPPLSDTDLLPDAAPREIAPRDIQVRVRAGESPDEVAASYGVDVGRIMRFAAPVLEERVRIADEARRARARRSKGESSEAVLVVFGEAVDERFGAYGIDAAGVGWSARRRDDGEWIVRAEWTGGSGRHAAEWAFHRTSRSMTALDDAATDLLSDRPIRPVVPEPAPPRVSLVAAPPLAPGVVAFPPLPHGEHRPSHAATDELPRLDDERAPDEVFDQEAPAGERGFDLGAILDGPAAAGFGFEEPPLPLGIADPTTRPLAAVGRRSESDDEKAARAKVPSWDDILLGVRRKRD